MTYLSHQDGEHTGRTSRELAEKLSFLDSDINILNGRLRRLAHVAVYAVLTILFAITLKLGGYFPCLTAATIVADCQPKRTPVPYSADSTRHN